MDLSYLIWGSLLLLGVGVIPIGLLVDKIKYPNENRRPQGRR